MKIGRLILASAAALAAAFVAGPAAAQKSNDTLRLVLEEPFSHLDHYTTGGNQVGFLARAMYGRLVVYNEHTGKFLPELAKSWRRINPTTLEFELRDDIHFHSGNKFTADDVKYTYDYLKDPKVKLRNKGRYVWMKEIEKTGPFTIRITAKEPVVDDMHIISSRLYIYDSKVHGSLDNPQDYGRVSPSTTGVYRVVSVDENLGAKFERFDPAVRWFPHRRAPIRYIHTVPVTDRQTQQAQLMTGNADALRNITADMGEQLGANPDVRITPVSSKIVLYITLDAAGRSDNKVFTDLRVRQAFMRAIPRDVIVKNFVPGAEVAVPPQAICYKEIEGCSYTTKPEAYDPMSAKKLLEQAGYPDGFDMTLSVNAPFKTIAEAISGELRKVGIRAAINPMLVGVMRKARMQGEVTALLSTFVPFAQPTAANVMNFFFRKVEDYTNDPLILKARELGASEFDLAKRTAIYREAFDRVNEMSYIYPLSELPLVFAHSKEVRIEPNLTTVAEARITDFFWN